ncbi:hypothetical protein UMM65_09040 [Aureibaculum sp. 2210JD6-5]|uniref:hypothetical protein n=1 Tax=Aureibaculum sp. 2210JD6-5 TaxID=3103957 RepID=UPI002AACBA5B|nr:hypothetical protein [Aureibaculum sp. 2210JD6-5]MDY7395384.1 hypothetical protein [Aureibaculum sp. 2210JD6-5]
MIKKLPLLIGLLYLSFNVFSQEKVEKMYYYTSPDTDGYISINKETSTEYAGKVELTTNVNATFGNKPLSFNLETTCDSDKMVMASKFSFDGKIDVNIQDVTFTGERIKIDKNETSFWHFKGDFKDEVEVDPDFKKFAFSKYNTTLKLPPRTVPSFNVWAIVPQLPFDRKGTFKFNVLDETKLYVRRNQTINYLGTTKTNINGEDIKLHKFVHQGDGIKPAYYWVSDDRKLMQVLLDDKYTFTLSTKEAALQTAMLTKNDE